MRAARRHSRILWALTVGQWELYTLTRGLHVWVLEIVLREGVGVMWASGL